MRITLKKRITAGFLLLVMLVMLIPVQAIAKESSPTAGSAQEQEGETQSTISRNETADYNASIDTDPNGTVVMLENREREQELSGSGSDDDSSQSDVPRGTDRDTKEETGNQQSPPPSDNGGAPDDGDKSPTANAGDGASGTDQNNEINLDQPATPSDVEASKTDNEIDPDQTATPSDAQLPGDPATPSDAGPLRAPAAGERTITVTKVWDDNNNEYGLRPENIEVYVEQHYNAYLPDEYQGVEYVQSSGTQWIDTGVNPAGKELGIEAVFQLMNTTNDRWVFGENYYSGGDRGAYQIGRYGNKFYFAIHSYNTVILFRNNSINADTAKHTLRLNITGEDSTFDGTRIGGSGYVIDQTGPNGSGYNFYLFGRGGNILGGYAASARIYRFKMYDGTDMIRDFVPCYRKSDEVIGLYDRVNNVFYTNKGTGTFSKGDDYEDSSDTSSHISTIRIADEAWVKSESVWTADVSVHAEGSYYAYESEVRLYEGDAPYESKKEITGDGVTITNTINVLTKDLTVTKNWNDDQNRLGVRPDSINVYIVKQRLPEEYQEIEYIANQSFSDKPNLAYVDTGVAPTDGEIGVELICSFDSTANDKWIMGEGVYSYGDVGAYVLGVYNNNFRFYVSKYDRTTLLQADSGTAGIRPDTKKHFFKLNLSGHGTSVDGQMIRSEAQGGSGHQVDNVHPSTGDGNIWLFARHGMGRQYWAIGRIYGCKMYNGTTLIRDFVPCYIRATGEAGFYDLVNDRFYGNDPNNPYYSSSQLLPGPNSAIEQFKVGLGTGDHHLPTDDSWTDTHTLANYDQDPRCEEWRHSDWKYYVFENVSEGYHGEAELIEHKKPFDENDAVEITNTVITKEVAVTKTWADDNTGYADLRKPPKVYIENEQLPLEYKELEYISNNGWGWPYIDTGVKPVGHAIGIDLTFKMEELGTDKWLLGASYNTMGEHEFGMYNTQFCFSVKNSGGGAINYHQFGRYDVEIHNIKANITGYGTSFDDRPVISGAQGAVVNAFADGNNDRTLYLFGRSGNYPKDMWARARVYGLKIYDGETLIRDMIPCYHIETDVTGMYDKVNGVFYTNENADESEFLRGPEVRNVRKYVRYETVEAMSENGIGGWRDNGDGTWTQYVTVPYYLINARYWEEPEVTNYAGWPLVDNKQPVDMAARTATKWWGDEDIDAAWTSEYNALGDWTADVRNTLNVHTLSVSKTVSGNMGNKAKEWSFELTIPSMAGEIDIPAQKTNSGGSEDVTLDFDQNGKASFTLYHGETLTIPNIPVGVQVSIEETDPATGYTTTYTVNGGETQSGKRYDIASLSEDTTVAYTNHKESSPPTGIMDSILPALIGTGFVVFLLLMLLMFRGRKRQDE